MSLSVPSGDCIAMYVCICHAVTDRQIRNAVRDGARSMRDISRELSVSTCCGKCGVTARRIVRDAVEAAEPPGPADTAAGELPADPREAG